jgi:hypothetical protein
MSAGVVVPRLRISGAIHFLLLYAFISCIGKILPFYVVKEKRSIRKAKLKEIPGKYGFSKYN